MIQTKKELQDILTYEKNIYSNFMGGGKYQAILRFIKSHPDYYTWKYVKLLRKTGYYYSNRNKNIFYSLCYFFFCRKKNILGRRLGIEMHERCCKKGLTIYHTQGIVVNGMCKIGKNFKLHGNNCLGTNGITSDCPIIGDNVTLGVGAKILGGVKIANNITVAAGAVVVSSCLEENVVLAGIPAKIVKNKSITKSGE